MANRIKDAVERMRLQIAGRIADGLTTQEAVDNTCLALDISFEEYCVFQEIKSEGYVSGLLTLAEATYVYVVLGSGPADFNVQPVEVKAAFTSLFKELLERKIGSRLSAAV